MQSSADRKKLPVEFYIGAKAGMRRDNIGAICSMLAFQQFFESTLRRRVLCDIPKGYMKIDVTDLFHQLLGQPYRFTSQFDAKKDT